MPLKIEKGIPIPDRRSIASDLARFEVGDSAFIADGNGSTLYNSIYAYGRRHQVSFRIKAVTEAGVDGFRIWRIA